MEIPPAKVRNQKIDKNYFVNLFVMFLNVISFQFHFKGFFGAEVYDTQSQHRRKACHYSDTDA